MKTFLITGGAGFVGANLAIRLKQNYEQTRVIALDNLKRRGAELNLSRLADYGVEFVHGDIRDREIVQRATEGMAVPEIATATWR